MRKSLSAITTKCLLISHGVAWVLALLAGFCVAYFNTLGKIDTKLRNTATRQADQMGQYVSFMSSNNPHRPLDNRLSRSLDKDMGWQASSKTTSSIRIYNSTSDLLVNKQPNSEPEFYAQKLEAGSSPNGFYRHTQSIATDHHGIWNVEVVLNQALLERKLSFDLLKQFITVLLASTLVFPLIFFLIKRSLIKNIVEIEIAKHTLENMEEGVVVIDNSDKVLNYNQSFIELVGIPEGIVETEGFRVHHLVNDVERMRQVVREALRQDQHWSGELQIRHRTKGLFPAKVNISIVRNNANRVAAFVIVINDLTAQKARERALEQLAYQDPLTALANRAYFDLRLKHELEVCKRLNRKLCLLFIDLDKFKFINDTFGHESGDQLLKVIAKRFRERLRSTDTLARIGGDEFTVILPDLDGNGGFEKLGKELIALAGSAIQLDHQEVFVGASIGAAVFPDDAGDIGSLLKQADTAMYRAKALGRNQIVFHNKERPEDIWDHRTIERELEQAIVHNQLELYYQPKINVRTGHIKGFEALLRWHRKDNIVLPNKFIPAIQQRGLSNQLDRWVINAGIQQLESWHQRFSPDISLALNISCLHFHDEELIAFLSNKIRQARIDPTKIEIEIKESALNRNIEQATLMIQSLKNIGVKIVIDDFGTGFSSIGCLGELPIDCLKIDRSFIGKIQEENKNQVVAKSVVSLANGLGIEVVAEGVEKELQATAVKRLGCQYAQGYFFSRPGTTQEAEHTLEDTYMPMHA